MEEELVEGAGKQVYIPILPTDNLIRMGLEREQVLGSPIPKMWAGVLEKNLRYHAVTEQWLYKSNTPRIRYKVPLWTRIKNNLATLLRHLATRLDGYDPEHEDD